VDLPGLREERFKIPFIEDGLLPCDREVHVISILQFWLAALPILVTTIFNIEDLPTTSPCFGGFDHLRGAIFRSGLPVFVRETDFAADFFFNFSFKSAWEKEEFNNNNITAVKTVNIICRETFIFAPFLLLVCNHIFLHTI
jgi:hypothetical protein